MTPTLTKHSKLAIEIIDAAKIDNLPANRVVSFETRKKMIEDADRILAPVIAQIEDTQSIIAEVGNICNTYSITEFPENIQADIAKLARAYIELDGSKTEEETAQ